MTLMVCRRPDLDGIASGAGRRPIADTRSETNAQANWDWHRKIAAMNVVKIGDERRQHGLIKCEVRAGTVSSKAWPS